MRYVLAFFVRVFYFFKDSIFFSGLSLWFSCFLRVICVLVYVYNSQFENFSHFLILGKSYFNAMLYIYWNQK